MLRKRKVLLSLLFLSLLLLSPEVFAACSLAQGDVNSDTNVDAGDLAWIKQHPDSFWKNILQGQMGNLNNFISQFKKNFNTDCPIELNILDFNVKGDGKTDDGPKFQEALTQLSSAGGGRLYLPAGEYFIDQTLIVGDNTEIYGNGEQTILKRGDTKSVGLPFYVGPTNCEEKNGFDGRELFRNEKFNCGNKKIHLHDFKIDGSKVVTIREGNYYFGAVTISFSAVEDLTIEKLHLVNVPQDGIFVKNGGVRTKNINNVIDGFNLRWHNGGGINIEMHTQHCPGCFPANFPTTASEPVLIENNIIIARGPNFCWEDGTKSCDGDEDCTSISETSKCGASNVAGIAASGKQGNLHPSVTITKNSLQVTDKHFGITCNQCQNSLITENIIEPFASDTAWSGLYSGISVEEGGSNVQIIKNKIIGNGKAGDGVGILLSSNYPDAEKAVVSGNVIENKDITKSGVNGAIQVRGYTEFEVKDNQILQVGTASGLEIGLCNEDWKKTTVGKISGNVINLKSKDSKFPSPIILNKVAELEIKNNVLVDISGNVLDQNIVPPAYCPNGPN